MSAKSLIAAILTLFSPQQETTYPIPQPKPIIAHQPTPTEVAVQVLSPLPTNEAPTKCKKPCQMSETGLILIRRFEGYSPFVYKDAAGLDTIGYGHLIIKGEVFKQPMMQAEAEALLRKDVASKNAYVNKVTILLYQYQHDAVVSFTFNLGTGALQSSTLLKYINAHRHSEVPAQFLRWVFADGKKLRGLEIRRGAEADMYSGK